MELSASLIGVKRLGLVAALVVLAMGGAARAERLSGASLVKALRQGGYVLLMRHASSPVTLPDTAHADAGNPKRERQLDKTGRETARAMGQAIRALHIRVGQVWSSPTYRALETVRLAGLPNPTTADQLGDGGQGMQAASRDQSAWLRTKVAVAPRAGTDTIFVTHLPNISAAFRQAAAGLADGEALVFHPNAKGAADLVGRIKIEAWPDLAAAR
jgi:phosphohistidine phosphatase SixA